MDQCWIGLCIVAKLCGGMILRVRFVCSGSTMCDGFSALCCGGISELAVQLYHLSHSSMMEYIWTVACWCAGRTDCGFRLYRYVMSLE